MEARTCEKCEGRGCGSCGGVGQVQVAHDLRTYNPATHVVVSRETAEIGGNACLWLSQDIDLPMEHRMDFHAADMDFRAAMEVGE
jgi:hypothetical protein